MSVACRTREFAVIMCTSLVFAHYRGPIEEYDEGMQLLPGMQPIFVSFSEPSVSWFVAFPV